MNLLDLRVHAHQRFAQRLIQRAHRAIALCRGVIHLAAHAHLYRRFGEDSAALAVLNVGRKIDQLERRNVTRLPALQHHDHGCLGCFVGEAFRLLCLQLLQNLRHTLATAQLYAVFLGLTEQVGLARKLRDHHTHLVAHQRRVDVVIGSLHPPDGMHVHAALMRKSRTTYIGHVLVGRQVRHLTDEVR